ncbi:MAG: DUF4926 domain-containing protein [Symplocastrum torsivum CPER-KK1]|jgi:hypothetical protein|uniref:DUF4926 domain-containing protein n=1 Tax=Symplocastrum torsivum CPER-KK1 TaxID=450513 RepID=A0A951PQF3_9CYAN|nr:DUF4926 domain-containing protein [Symplocastrum torsivum CPER-KK1]
MTEPELFDVIELLVDLPEYNLRSGVQGAIVECYPGGTYEVEFSNKDGETLVDFGGSLPAIMPPKPYPCKST